MTGSTDRMWQDAVETGQANQQVVELGRRHCLNMRFVSTGGIGMVEQQTGLPIGMRQVRCPVAIGPSSSNLQWVATDFYRAHCVGCTQRRPTGDVPNLASLVETADAESAAETNREQAPLAQASTA
jgi:hypothetical protein